MTDQRYVVLEGSEVVNIIIWNDEDANAEFAVPEGQTVQLATGDESIGWKLVNNEWVAPLVEEAAAPVEDTSVMDAKYSALKELTDLGVSEKNARIIVGLPPAEEVPA